MAVDTGETTYIANRHRYATICLWEIESIDTVHASLNVEFINTMPHTSNR